MKTNNSLVVAVVVFSIFASNAFAALRPPYPTKAYPPDRIILNGEERHDYTFQKRHQLFDQDPEVDTDTAVARHNRIEEVIFVYARMMPLLRSDTRAL